MVYQSYHLFPGFSNHLKGLKPIRIRGLKDELSGTTSSQTSKLAKAFQAMDAGQEAKIAGNLDDCTLTDLLLQIRERNAAKILATLDPSHAARIYKQLSSKSLQASSQ